MKRKWFKRILVILAAGLLLIQFVPSGLDNQDDYSKRNIMFVQNTDSGMSKLLIENCMDCHSSHVRKPWYFNIRPITFVLVHHVKEGTEHVNFGEWAEMDLKEKKHALEECIEMLEEGEMPLKSYTITHPEMSVEQKEEMINWFKSLQSTINNSNTSFNFL